MSAPNSAATKFSMPQVKICGITVVEDGLACAALGADAIGLVLLSVMLSELAKLGHGSAVPVQSRAIMKAFDFVGARCCCTPTEPCYDARARYCF